MAIYAVDRFAADDVLAGLASSSYVFGALVSRLASAAIVDRFGARRLYSGGAIAATLACSLYLVADTLWLLLIVRFVHGIAFGLAHSSIGAMGQSRIPASRRGEGNGYFTMAATVGAAVGPLLAVILTRDGAFIPLFIGAAGISLAALVAGWFIRPIPSDRGAPRTTDQKLGLLAAPAVPIGTVAFLQSLAYASLTAFLAQYSQEIDAPAAAGGFFLVYAGCVLVVRTIGGRLYDRFGSDVIMFPGLALYAGGMVLLALVPSFWAVLAAAALIGVGYGTLLPTGMAIAAERVGADRPGGAYATYFLFVDLGYAVGPMAMGWVLGMAGWSGMFFAGAAAAILTGALYIAVQRAHTSRTR